MLFTIEAETAEELRTKLIEAAAVFGARAATAVATPPAETAATEAPKKRGPKPKAPAAAPAPQPLETTVTVTSSEPVATDVHVEPAADDAAKTYTIEDVREAGKLLSTKKGIIKAREVLAEFSGATRPSDLKPEDYKAFVKRANAEANRK